MNRGDKIFLSFDISTTCIGISVFSEKKDLLLATHLVLDIDKDVDKDHRYLIKANMFKEYVERFKDYVVLDIFVEEPLGNSNNRQTANLLTKFNGICCYILHSELNCLPKLVSVNSVRKKMCPEFVRIIKDKEVFSFPKELDKKEYIFNKISKMYPGLNWIKDKKNNIHKYSYDITDSIAVGLYFLTI